MADELIEDFLAPAREVLEIARTVPQTVSGAISLAVTQLASMRYSLNIDPSLTQNEGNNFSNLEDAINSTPAGCYLVLNLKGDIGFVKTTNLEGRYLVIQPHPDLGLSDDEYVEMQGNMYQGADDLWRVFGIFGGIVRFINIHLLSGKKGSADGMIGFSFVRATEIPNSVLFRSCKVILQHVSLFNTFIGRFSSIGSENGGSGLIIEHDSSIADGEHGKLCNFGYSGTAASFANYTLPEGKTHITQLCTGVLTDADGQAKNLVSNIPNWHL